MVGPELRKFIDTHDFSFSTMNAIEKYGGRLLRVVGVLKETSHKLKEALKDPGQERRTSIRGSLRSFWRRNGGR